MDLDKSIELTTKLAEALSVQQDIINDIRQLVADYQAGLKVEIDRLKK